jgi:succinate-acetate transporter protein
MLLGGTLEFILGNTFPFVVFVAYGAFWLAFAATLQPFYFAYGSYAPAGSPEAAGLQTVGFNASFAFFLLFMGLLSLIFLICSLRTNVVFVIIFLTLVPAFGCLAGAYWQLGNSFAAAAREDMATAASAASLAGRLQIAGGACAFVTSMAGWWIFFAIMLAALDFPFQIPVGDLSTMIKGASERAKAKENMV